MQIEWVWHSYELHLHPEPSVSVRTPVQHMVCYVLAHSNGNTLPPFSLRTCSSKLGGVVREQGGRPTDTTRLGEQDYVAAIKVLCSVM